MKILSLKLLMPIVLGSLLSPLVLAGGEAGALNLRDLGSKYIAFSTEETTNGTLNVMNPMFVQYVLPQTPRHKYPVIFIHGGGGQGTDWMQTPDGRDGWVDYFVAEGWDVYVVDRPGHGRSQSNPTCASINGMSSSGVANTGIISMLSKSDANKWPGGEPTPTNSAVIAWAASSTTAPYCGDEVAAHAIAALLHETGPAILIAHSAGGGSTFLLPDLIAENIIGIIAFEAVGSYPTATEYAGRRTSPAILNWKTSPELSEAFIPTDFEGCQLQGGKPSKLTSFQDIPLILVTSEYGLGLTKEILLCQQLSWQQAGVETEVVYLPDRGLVGGGHFAMAQTDTANYARIFIELATDIETKKSK
jgi:pimeloyl-ACP methyl ester carboxylesterase